MSQAPKHILLVNGLVFKSNRLLVAQRSFAEINEPGYWTIPGGKVETTAGNVWRIAEKTLIKEVREETGVTIHPQANLLINNTFIRSTGEHVVAFVFAGFWRSGRARALEDTIAVHWIRPEEISQFKMSAGVRKYIRLGFKWLKNSQV